MSSKLLDFLRPTTSPPSGPAQKRTAAELRQALELARAKLPELQAAISGPALDLADGIEGAEDRVSSAQADLATAERNIAALAAALSAAEKREGAQAAAKRFEVQSLQADNCKRLLARRENAAAELSAAIEAAVAAWRKLLDLSERAAICHPIGKPTTAMLQYRLGNPQIEALVKAEIFRQGGQTFRGGDPRIKYPPSFPGGQPPTLGLSPERIKPLTDAVAEANDFAVQAIEQHLASIKPVEA